ncbi:hypothetical protein GCM10010472_21800 [Pseudonocardia halophobica]|uniref:hypothetical protein n=1 Tax=Pseudonocardia halophobica TaxID=29401 RepID=UPI0031DC533F
MDLRTRLRRYAARRPHVLVVATRNGAAVRLAVEAELATRGWPAATAPADADVLLVAGTAGPELATTVEDLWATVPLPRAYVTVDAPDAVERELSRVPADLARGRSGAGPVPNAATAPPEQIEDGQGDEPQDPGEDPDDDKQGEHGGHDEMDMPGGLPMADLGDDRDGLTLDQLHVALGPVLPDWPAGLVLEVVLQGDVVQQAHARLVDDPLSKPFWTPREPGATDGAPVDPRRLAAARELDALARFLAVAGWPAPAARARGLRDGLLAGDPLIPICGAVEALLRQVRRSRTLRRLLRGLPHVPALFARRLDALEHASAALNEPTAGAIRSSLTASAGRPSRSPQRTQPRAGLHEVERLLAGSDLAAARLLVAAADPVTDGGTSSTAGGTSGLAADTHAVSTGRDVALRAGHSTTGSDGAREGERHGTTLGKQVGPIGRGGHDHG